MIMNCSNFGENYAVTSKFTALNTLAEIHERAIRTEKVVTQINCDKKWKLFLLDFEVEGLIYCNIYTCLPAPI
jgi:hypothetical protein